MKKGTLTSPSSFYVRSVLGLKDGTDSAAELPEPPTLVDPVSVDRMKSVLENALREQMAERDKKQSSNPPPLENATESVAGPAVPQAPRPMKAGLPTVISSSRPPPKNARSVAPVVQAVVAATLAVAAALFILIGAH